MAEQDKVEEMVAVLAVATQRTEDRLEAAEGLFKSSVVIPSSQMELIASKLNAILITSIILGLMFCIVMLAFIVLMAWQWYLDRPI